MILLQMTEDKTTLLKARVTEAMKDEVEAFALETGESTLFVIRQALREYMRRHAQAEREQRIREGGERYNANSSNA